MGLIQEMSKEVQPLIRETKSESGGNPEEFRLAVIKLRPGFLGKTEALMSDAQKKQWQKMIGKLYDALRNH